MRVLLEVDANASLRDVTSALKALLSEEYGQPEAIHLALRWERHARTPSAHSSGNSNAAAHGAWRTASSKQDHFELDPPLEACQPVDDQLCMDYSLVALWLPRKPEQYVPALGGLRAGAPAAACMQKPLPRAHTL